MNYLDNFLNKKVNKLMKKGVVSGKQVINVSYAQLQKIKDSDSAFMDSLSDDDKYLQNDLNAKMVIRKYPFTFFICLRD